MIALALEGESDGIINDGKTSEFSKPSSKLLKEVFLAHDLSA